MFPALLFAKTTQAPIEEGTIGPYAAALISAMLLSGVIAAGGAKLIKRSPPVCSSVFQGAARHNTFIAFAVADALFGADGLVLAALATAVLVPVTNLACVSALVLLHGNAPGTKLSRRLVQEFARNPLLIAIAAGLFLNVSGLGPLPVVHDMADILSRAALPVALLSVGAGLHLQAIRIGLYPTAIATVGKLILFPAIVFLCLHVTRTTGLPAHIAAIYATVPTAVSGYALARQLGGDAPLMAGIITVQTLLSMVTMPLGLFAAMILFSPG